MKILTYILGRLLQLIHLMVITASNYITCSRPSISFCWACVL